jgi:hypothetical protein
MPFCEICHFDNQRRIVSGGCYYDQYTPLTQLGHIQPLAMAAKRGNPRSPKRLFALNDDANSVSRAGQARYLAPPRDPLVGAVARHLWYLAAR